MYHTGVNDILLSALSRALHRWKGIDGALINLEGHGRNEAVPLNINRTIGWFTCQFPVVLHYTPDMATHIRGIKETLHKIPNKGLGYGILKYLWHEKSGYNRIMETEPGISFNYLGQFVTNIGDITIKFMNNTLGGSFHPDNEITYPVTINCILIDDALQYFIGVDGTAHTESSALSLVNCLKEELIMITTHCGKKKEVEYSPGDFDAKDLSMEELDEILNMSINESK